MLSTTQFKTNYAKQLLAGKTLCDIFSSHDKFCGSGFALEFQTTHLFLTFWFWDFLVINFPLQILLFCSNQSAFRRIGMNMRFLSFKCEPKFHSSFLFLLAMVFVFPARQLLSFLHHVFGISANI